jgi:hypothetical protein
MKDGRWVPTANNADPNTRGFTLNQMYSFTVTPVEIAVAYHRGAGDEAARREFHNSKIGQPYIEGGSQVTDSHVDLCLGKYASNSNLPKIGDERLITLGVDQGKFHHWVAVEWRLRKTDGGILSDKALGKVIGFGKVFQDDWDQLGQLMRTYQVKAAVVDFFPDPTNGRRFARKFPGYVWLCQYVQGRAAREISIFEDEFGANVAKVDRTDWVAKALGRVMMSEIQFPQDISLEFRQHLKNQVRSYKKGQDGNYQAEYLPLGADHYAHALTYAEIALHVLEPNLGGYSVITNPRN